MKKIITKSLTLALYSVVAYVALASIMCLVKVGGRPVASWALPYVQRIGGPEWFAFRDLKQGESGRNYDYIVLGSSRAMHGCDPRVFRQHGYELYNMGSNNQHIGVSRILAEEYLDYPQNPIFLIDVYYAVYAGDGMEGTARMMANLPDTRPALSLLESSPDVRTLNAFVCRLFRDESIAELGCPDYVENGYSEKDDTIKTELPVFNETHEYNENLFHELDKLLDLLEERKCRYALIAHPMTHASGFRKVHETFLEKLLPVVEDHKALLIDHTLENYLNDQEHFYNPSHLNHAGAEIFNERLLVELKSRGLIPNHESKDVK